MWKQPYPEMSFIYYYFIFYLPIYLPMLTCNNCQTFIWRKDNSLWASSISLFMINFSIAQQMSNCLKSRDASCWSPIGYVQQMGLSVMPICFKFKHFVCMFCLEFTQGNTKYYPISLQFLFNTKVLLEKNYG